MWKCIQTAVICKQKISPTRVKRRVTHGTSQNTKFLTVSPAKRHATHGLNVCLTRKKCVSLTKIPFSSNRQESIIEHRWSDFGQFCELNNLREVIIDGDGYCFPNAVHKCLMHDFYKFYTIQQIQDIVCEHLADSFEEYIIFRWFTLKPPNSITYGNLLSAIWDTFHWNFFVKFGLKTA